MTLPCPGCGRPLGLKARRCLYCGHRPTPDAAEQAENRGGDSGLDPERARAARDAYLALSPELRALVPPEVAAQFEGQEEAVARPSSPGPVPTRPAPAPPTRRAPPARVAAPPPVPTPPPPTGIDFGALAAEAGSTLLKAGTLLGYAIPGHPEVGGVIDAVSTAVATMKGDLQAHAGPPPGHGAGLFALSSEALPWPDRLRRGHGPFGVRTVAHRLVLLPDPGRYRANLPWLRHRLQARCGLDLYSAGRLLQRDVPGLLFATDDPEERDTVAAAFPGLHLAEVDREAFISWGGPLITNSMALEGEDAILSGPEGERRLPKASFRGVVLAELAAMTPDDQLAVERDRYMRAGSAQRPTLAEHLATMMVADLHSDALDRPIRVAADSFDFSILGDLRSLSALRNLRLLASVLGDLGLALPIDERFRRVGTVPGPELEPSAVLTRRLTEFTEYSLLIGARMGAKQLPVRPRPAAAT